jgi:hypothetical protein
MLGWPKGQRGGPLGLASSPRYSVQPSHGAHSFRSLEATGGLGLADGGADSPVSVAITPLNNSYGSYATVIGPLTEDAWFLEIHMYHLSPTAIRDTIVSFAVDPDGGTNYLDQNIIIPHLLTTGCSWSSSTQPGHFYFPLFVAKGCTIGAKASQNNATPVNIEVGIRAFGKPANPWALRKGRIVDAYGIVEGSSSGTAVTQAGSGGAGTWTQLGTAAYDYWWMQPGIGIPDSIQTNQVMWHEYSIGFEGGDVPLCDWMAGTNTNEVMRWQPRTARRPVWVPAGSRIWGRSSASGTADTFRMSFYGVRV